MINNLAADRANICHLHVEQLDLVDLTAETITTDHLIVTADLNFPDGSLKIDTRGAGTHLTAVPEDGDLVSPNTFYMRTVTAGTDVSFVTTPDNITINSLGASGVTLTSAGGTESLVNDGVGPTLATKGLTAGTGVSLASDAVSVTITNSSPASSVTLTSAGGTETLVNDGTGPTLATKGLSAGTGISLSSGANAVTITNSSPASSVTLASAGGTSIVTDGTGPSLEVKGTNDSGLLQDTSNASTIRFDNIQIRISDSAGNKPPVLDPVSNSTNNSIVMGANANSTGTSDRSVVIGRNAFCNNTPNAVVLGEASATNSDSAVVIGRLASVTSATPAAVAIGDGAQTSGNSAVVIGENGNVTQNRSVGVGGSVDLTGSSNVGVGYHAGSTFDRNVLLGTNLVSGSNESYMIGTGLTAPDRLASTEDGLFCATRTTANASQTYLFSGTNVGYAHGRWASFLYYYPAGAGATYTPTAQELVSGFHILTGGATIQMDIPSAAALTALTTSWGLNGGVNTAPLGAGFPFYVSNRTGGTVNLSLGVGVTLVDADGSSINTGMTTGFTHAFWIFSNGAGPAWILAHLGAMPSTLLT